MKKKSVHCTDNYRQRHRVSYFPDGKFMDNYDEFIRERRRDRTLKTCSYLHLNHP